jgi:uncharacterized OsmC-like protein
MLSEAFCRHFAASPPLKATVRSIINGDWFCLNKEGKGVHLSTDGSHGPRPLDALLMAYGACAASGLRFLLEKRGKQVETLITDVEGILDQKGEKLTDISLHFKIDVNGVTQEELEAIVTQIEAKMCPIHQTLKAGTKIKAVH